MLIPIYNVVVLLRIVRRPTWWAVLFFIPPIAVVFAVITAIDLAKAFGKGAGFGVGLTFLPAFFYPALGFGDARYNGVALSGAPAAATA